MVQFKNLNNPSEKSKRKIREQVFVGGETITIYEPNKADIDVIIDLQGDFVEEDREEKIDVSGTNVVRVLFPLLTNIEGLENLTDEEIDDIIENPTIALIQAQHVIEQIVIEVYKMVILSARKHLLEQDFELETYKTSSEVIERTMGLAAKNNETAGAVEKIKQAQANIEKVQAQEAEKLKSSIDRNTVDISKKASVTKIELINKPEPEEQESVNIGQHANEVAKFRNVFGDSED